MEAQPAPGLPVEEAWGMPEQEGSSTPAGLLSGPPLSTHRVAYLAVAPLKTPSKKDPAGIARHSLKHRTSTPRAPEPGLQVLCNSHMLPLCLSGSSRPRKPWQPTGSTKGEKERPQPSDALSRILTHMACSSLHHKTWLGAGTGRTSYLAHI